MQTKEDTRRVVDLCSNYYSIINEPIAKNDIITKELCENYKFAIQNTDSNDDLQMKNIRLFDDSLYLYFNNEKFKEKFLLEFKQLDSNNTIENALCASYISYKNDPKNKIVTTKWI